MSNKNIKYRQCTLSKEKGYVREEIVSWLPEKVKTEKGLRPLKIDMIVSLKGEDVWSENWRIVDIGETALEDAPDWRAMVKGHRKKTGDSLKRK